MQDQEQTSTLARVSNSGHASDVGGHSEATSLRVALGFIGSFAGFCLVLYGICVMIIAKKGPVTYIREGNPLRHNWGHSYGWLFGLSGFSTFLRGLVLITFSAVSTRYDPHTVFNNLDIGRRADFTGFFCATDL